MAAAITETEIQAFVDGQLDPMGRVEVINHFLNDFEGTRSRPY